MVVEKSTRISDIWNLFYNRLNTDVTSVTLADASTSTIQRYSESYSQEVFNSLSNFPMLIIESPTLEDEPKTFKKEQTSCEIVVEIYTTSAQAADKFSDAILNSIETYKKTLADNKLQRITGELSDIDNTQNGSIMIHVRRMRFRMRYIYTKTIAY